MCVANESIPTGHALTAAQLLDLVFSQARGTIARLDQGANLLFANCGRGAVLAELAQRFPRSRFFGLEASFPDVTAARDHLLQNLWFEADARLLPRLNGIFDFAFREPDPRGARLADMAHLLRHGGLLFDLHAAEPDQAGYWREKLVVIRHVPLPDGFCTISRK